MPFFSRRKASDDGRVATIEDMRRLLGDHVCDAREVQLTHRLRPRIQSSPLFLLSYIEMCALQNKKRYADWWLMYSMGFSIEHLRSDPITGGYFFRKPFELDENSDWLTRHTFRDYWLINMKIRFTNMSIDRQARELTAMGPEYELVPENVFAGSLFMIHRLRNQRLFERHFYQGPNGRLGYFGNSGLILFGSLLPHLCRKDTGAVQCINPLKQIQE